MKIAVTTYAMHVGGLETFILSLARGFVEAGHEVHVVSTDEPGEWFERPREIGAKPHFIERPPRGSRAGHARAVGRFLAAAGFDVVINNASWFVQASLGMLPARTATVSVIHNSVEPVIALACANQLACDAFVAPSQATLALAQGRLSVPEKIHFIPHGVEAPTVFPKLSSGADAGAPLSVIFCGRLYHPQKGIFLLPDIMQRVIDSTPDARLEIVGDGPDREEFNRLVAESKLSGAIHILGALSHEESLDRIEQASALVLPSFYEGLPLVPLEAMARGVVPVVSLLPGITDTIIEDGVSGFLVSPGDVEDFSDALIRLARDRELRHRMSRAAWEVVRERFSVTTMVRRYLDLLEDLRRKPRRVGKEAPLAPDLVRWRHRLPALTRRA